MSEITPAERSALLALLRTGTVKGAAYALGKSPRTISQQLATARDRLAVTTTIEAVRVVFIDRKPAT